MHRFGAAGRRARRAVCDRRFLIIWQRKKFLAWAAFADEQICSSRAENSRHFLASFLLRAYVFRKDK